METKSRYKEYRVVYVTEKGLGSLFGSNGIPVQKVQVNGNEVTFIALPLIFERFHEQGKPPKDGTAEELLNNEDMKEFYLAGGDQERKSFKNLKSYKRRKRWM